MDSRNLLVLQGILGLGTVGLGVPRVVAGMEILGERPAWSMTDSEKLSRLDAAVAELARLKTYYLHLDRRPRRLRLRQRHRRRRHRTPPVHALPHRPGRGPPRPTPRQSPQQIRRRHRRPPRPRRHPRDSHKQPTRPMDPAQAAVIVAELDRAPADTPPENLAVAERQLVNLARTFTPGRTPPTPLTASATILDPDGPEPDENRAYTPRIPHPQTQQPTASPSAATWPTRTPNSSAPSSTAAPNPTKPSTATPTPAPATNAKPTP